MTNESQRSREMNGFVELELKRNRGWPWPEDSYGLTPMYGEDGWCRSCGVPRHGQTGQLVLQRRGFKTVAGAWMPNWLFDALCVERSLGERLAKLFRVELREIQWRGNAPGDARQIMAPVIGDAWFDHDALGERLAEQHGNAGAACPACGVWRWLPLGFAPVPPMTDKILPPLLDVPGLQGVDIAASPEWFGDGLQAFRLILVRRVLAELVVGASPRDFRIVTPAFAASIIH
jgi:hypothetical protein